MLYRAMQRTDVRARTADMSAVEVIAYMSLGYCAAVFAGGHEAVWSNAGNSQSWKTLGLQMSISPRCAKPVKLSLAHGLHARTGAQDTFGQTKEVGQCFAKAFGREFAKAQELLAGVLELFWFLCGCGITDTGVQQVDLLVVVFKALHRVHYYCSLFHGYFLLFCGG
jgi:hypothetical protein